MKFYYCAHCGNIIYFLKDSGVPVTCCNEVMSELVPGTVDAALEKHVPVVTQEGSTVTVNIGAVNHPMLEEHFIQWIILETEQGSQLKRLSPSESPNAVFSLAPGDKVAAAYEYCNLHGLWKS